MGVTDLNFLKTSKMPLFRLFLEENHAHRETRLCPINGSSSNANISSLRESLRWKSQGQIIQLSRPIPLYELRSINLQRKPSGYRSLSSRPARKALPHGISRGDFSQQSFQCKQNTRLSNLRRLCSVSDQDCQTSLRQGRFRTRSRQHGLRARRIHNRSLPFGFSLGAISFHQISSQTPYTARFTRQYPKLHPYLRWQATRGKCTRYSHTRARSVLHHGSRVSGFRAALYSEPGRRIFCHSSQEQYPIQTPVFSSRRQIQRIDMRSDYYSDGCKFQEGLSSDITAHQISRQKNRQNFQFSNQQLFDPRTDRSRSLSVSMASRTIFQMDQTTPENQVLLWYFRERREESDLDRYLGLRAHSHHKKAAQTQKRPLHNITDFKPESF